MGGFLHLHLGCAVHILGEMLQDEMRSEVGVVLLPPPLRSTVSTPEVFQDMMKWTQQAEASPEHGKVVSKDSQKEQAVYTQADNIVHTTIFVLSLDNSLSHYTPCQW